MRETGAHGYRRAAGRQGHPGIDVGQGEGGTLYRHGAERRGHSGIDVGQRDGESTGDRIGMNRPLG